MIDTCPPQIATWSSDGLTFLIKNTHLFETTIIPQYFKHSKFSSFVRQLNFYGFRKIRLDNSLKIDLEKEREQRNFWRFRHENFRRGRKDLLREIKRHASSSSSSSDDEIFPEKLKLFGVGLENGKVGEPCTFIIEPEQIHNQKNLSIDDFKIQINS